MTSMVERLGPDDGTDQTVVMLHPRRPSSRPMPKSWTEAIEREIARFAALREEITALAAVRPAPPSAPDPIDPAPLIEAALVPIRECVSEIAAATKAAQGVAGNAMEKAEEAARLPRQSVPEQVLVVFQAIRSILAIRLLLFLSVAGSFALAVMAMTQQSWLSLAIVGAFAGLTIGPLAALEIYRNTPRNA